MKKNFSRLIAVLIINFGLSIPMAAFATTFVQDYYSCARFLKLSPRQQRQAFIPGHLSFQKLTSSCRILVHHGLRYAAALDRQVARANRESSDDGSYESPPNYHDECSGTPGSINCTNHGPGSIYDRAGCNQTPSSFNCS